MAEKGKERKGLGLAKEKGKGRQRFLTVFVANLNISRLVNFHYFTQ